MIAEIVIASKQCTTCEETKPLSQFHRQPAAPDGLRYACKACSNARTRASIERRRAEMGEEAWLAQQRAVVQKYRQNPAARAKAVKHSARQHAALAELRDRHRPEYEAILARLKYEEGRS